MSYPSSIIISKIAHDFNNHQSIIVNHQSKNPDFHTSPPHSPNTYGRYKILIDNQEDVSITALVDQVKNIFLDRMNRIYRMGSASPTVKCGRLSPSTVLMLRYGYLSIITVGRRSRPHPVNPVHPVKKTLRCALIH